MLQTYCPNSPNPQQPHTIIECLPSFDLKSNITKVFDHATIDRISSLKNYIFTSAYNTKTHSRSKSLLVWVHKFRKVFLSMLSIRHTLPSLD